MSIRYLPLSVPELRRALRDHQESAALRSRYASNPSTSNLVVRSKVALPDGEPVARVRPGFGVMLLPSFQHAQVEMLRIWMRECRLSPAIYGVFRHEVGGMQRETFFEGAVFMFSAERERILFRLMFDETRPHYDDAA